MKSFYKLLLASAMLATATGISSAAVVNEDFENGLTGWTSTGDVAVQGPVGGKFIVLTSAYTGGLDDVPALNLSGTNPVESAGSLDGFVGLALGALDLDAINQATEGSAFKRTFSVTAGDIFSFDWQLATMETVGQDYAFITIGGVKTTLGNVASALNAGTGSYTSESGVGHFQYAFPTSGDFTIAFGVTDVGDYAGSTALRVDNVSVVPEPSAALLCGLGALGLLRRRR